jgi:hypothetical protein
LQHEQHNAAIRVYFTEERFAELVNVAVGNVHIDTGPPLVGTGYSMRLRNEVAYLINNVLTERFSSELADDADVVVAEGPDRWRPAYWPAPLAVFAVAWSGVGRCVVGVDPRDGKAVEAPKESRVAVKAMRALGHPHSTANTLRGHKADATFIDDLKNYKPLPSDVIEPNVLTEAVVDDWKLTPGPFTVDEEQVKRIENLVTEMHAKAKQAAIDTFLAEHPGANGVRELTALHLHDEIHYRFEATYDGWTAQQCLDKFKWFMSEHVTPKTPGIAPLTALQKRIASEMWSAQLRVKTITAAGRDAARAVSVVCDDDRWDA